MGARNWCGCRPARLRRRRCVLRQKVAGGSRDGTWRLGCHQSGDELWRSHVFASADGGTGSHDFLQLPIVTAARSRGVLLLGTLGLQRRWLEPPAYVHQMIASAWRSDALLVDSSDCGTVCGSTTGGPGGAGTSCPHAAAQRGVDGLITLQLLNMGTSAVDFNVTFSGHATAVAHGWQLHATHVEGVNTPSDPLKIVPRKVSVDLHQSIFVPAQTFLVVELDAWTDEELGCSR